jgi:hypothetical protein
VSGSTTQSNNKLISFGKKPQRERPRKNEFMPWKSEAQERWGNSPSGHAALGDAGVAEWNQASKGKKLPKRVKAQPGRISGKQHKKLADKWGKDDDGDKINASSR